MKKPNFKNEKANAPTLPTFFLGVIFLVLPMQIVFPRSKIKSLFSTQVHLLLLFGLLLLSNDYFDFF